jgi:FkbM family methyltransferase
MKIRVMAVCKNEEAIMPFFIRHYVQFVDEILLIDGHSTDNSIVEALRYGQGKVKIKNLDEGKELDDVTLMNIRNFAWKEGRADFDWQIVCDMDEFLFHPDTLGKLMEYKEAGVTIPKIAGYNMISMEFPKNDQRQITDQIIRGVRDSKWLDKSMIFNPKVVDINYEMGCHTANPSGEVKYSENFELALLHYKWLSHEYFTSRAAAANARRSEENIKNNLGFHLPIFAEMPKAEYLERFIEAKPIIEPRRTYLEPLEPFVYNEMFNWNVYRMFREELQGISVLDIGGHFGMFSLRAHDMGAKKIIAVEANHNNFSKYIRNTIDIPNRTVIHAACTTRTGDVVSINDEKGCSTIGKPGFNIGTIAFAEVVDLFDRDEEVVLKMDIEGAEHPILEGTDPSLFRRFKMIFIELHEDNVDGSKRSITEVAAKIASWGFQQDYHGTFFTTFPDGSVKPKTDVAVFKFKRI